MESPSPAPAPPEKRAAGLPPVTPPSGRFIAQLFLVPGMIVLVAVLMLLAFRFLLGGGYQPENFLKQLDSDNADIRWRGASDLAQVLKRPESMNLRSDPAFALDLVGRLKTALDDLHQEEARIQDKTAKATPAEKEAAWGKPLDSRRNHVTFLAASLGDFVAPVGVPLLSDMALRAESPDPKNILRRRQALSALINLGESVKNFAKLPQAQQTEILDALAKEAASADAVRARAARNALHHLDKTRLPTAASTDIVAVDQTLAKVALDQDQFLRSLVAFGFNFWDGPLAEPTLQLLARDKGAGTMVRLPE